MKAYKVLSQLNHDNLSYVPDEEISLDDRAAKSLLDCGVIELMNESAEVQEDTDPINDPGASIDNPDADDDQPNEQAETKPARKNKK